MFPMKSKLLFTCLMAGLICSNSFSQTFVEQHGQLKVSGNRIVDKDNKVVTLRGMSLYCWADQGTQFYNATAIKRLVDEWKCTVIRVPILPAKLTFGTPIVKTAVKACIANGVYVIIDWHSMGNAVAADASEFFKSMATLYGNTPNVLYETWNEPVSESWSTIKAYHTTVISAIRSIDPDNIILCGNPMYDQNPLAAASDPITTSTNIAYTVHYYAATHKQAVRTNVSSALAKGVAIFASEYGLCAANGAGSIDQAESQTWWNFLDENSIGSTNWSVAALEEASACFNLGANATRWTDADLKQSGTLVKAYLIDKNKGLVNVAVPDLSGKSNHRETLSGRNLINGDKSKTSGVFTLNGAKMSVAADGIKPANGFYTVKANSGSKNGSVNYIR